MSFATNLETSRKENKWEIVGWKPTLSSLPRTGPTSIGFFVVGTLSFLAGLFFLSLDSTRLNIATIILMGVAALALVTSVVLAVQVETSVNLNENSFRRGRHKKSFSEVKQIALFAETTKDLQVEGVSFKFIDDSTYFVPLAGNTLSVVDPAKQAPLLLEAISTIEQTTEITDTENLHRTKEYLAKF